MKTIALGVFLFAFVIHSNTQHVPPSQVTLLMKLHNECKQDTGISDELATKAVTGQFPTDPIFKKHVLCICKKMGTMNDDGHFDKETMKGFLQVLTKDETKAEQYVEECAVEKDTPEDSAFEAYKCLYIKTHSKD